MTPLCNKSSQLLKHLCIACIILCTVLPGTVAAQCSGCPGGTQLMGPSDGGCVWTWTGAQDSLWHRPENWLADGATTTTAPACYATVYIPAGADHSPAIVAPGATCHHLHIMPGATLALATDSATLTLNGDLNQLGTLQATVGTLYIAGSRDQHLSGGMAAGQALPRLVINKTGGACILQAPLHARRLQLQRGQLLAQDYEVRVLDADTDALSHYSDSSYVVGLLRRAVSGTGTYGYPLGTPTHYQLLQLDITQDLNVPTVLGKYTPEDPGQPTAALADGEWKYGMPVPVHSSVCATGYWSLWPETNPAAAGRYGVRVYPQGFACALDNATLLKREHGQDSWEWAGSYRGAEGIARQGYRTFSDYAVSPLDATMALASPRLKVTPQPDGLLLQWYAPAPADYLQFYSSSSATPALLTIPYSAAGTYLLPTADVQMLTLCAVDADNLHNCSNTVEIAPLQSAQPMKLWPMPAASGSTLWVQTGYPGQLQLLDAMGRPALPAAQQQDNTTTPLQLTGLAAGMYTLQHCTTTGCTTQRVVIY